MKNFDAAQRAYENRTPEDGLKHTCIECEEKYNGSDEDKGLCQDCFFESEMTDFENDYPRISKILDEMESQNIRLKIENADLRKQIEEFGECGK